jgi:asparagine synthase (glutamine-hydrolysing)
LEGIRRYGDVIAGISQAELMFYMGNTLLRDADVYSMAHSLEVREPLMDHKLVEWAATLPSHLKLRGGNGKHFLKKAMESHLPSDVLYRPKMGFAVPLARWFRGPLRARVRSSLLGGPMLDGGWLNPTVVQQIVEQHESGAMDHSTPIWTMLMFDAFLRKTTGAVSEAEVPEPALT